MNKTISSTKPSQAVALRFVLVFVFDARGRGRSGIDLEPNSLSLTHKDRTRDLLLGKKKCRLRKQPILSANASLA